MDRGTRRARSDSARKRRSFLKGIQVYRRALRWSKLRRQRKSLHKKRHVHGHD